MSVSNRVRRARPSLGTFVEITARGDNELKLHRAVDRAFDAIDCVHRQMSFHESASDVSRINRDAYDRKVTVDPWTWQVLKTAQRFSSESEGVFDVTIARELSIWNYLPQRYRNVRKGNWRDIVLEKRNEVRFRRRVIIDLGGIAKGFAVDRAVEVLERAGVPAGIVNAGGDLSVFGSKSELVHLRSPNSPAQFSGALRVSNRAVATSATYFSRRSLIDGQTRRAKIRQLSVSISASDCMTADALTKIVFVLREKSAPLLVRYGADALLLKRDGSPRWIFQAHAA